MKISWGIKIAGLYIGFIILILSLVSMAVRQNVDLVSKDYYEQELKFQNKIDKVNLTRSLKEQVNWEIKQESLCLKFPEQFKGKKINGSIYFFRPSDASYDKTISLSTDTILLNIPIAQLKMGMYKIQIDWEVDNNQYYNEGVIQIN